MADNVINFPTENRSVKRSEEDKYGAEHKENGRQAGKVLSSTRVRLTWEDRTSIARRLYDEIAASGVKPGRIAAAARLANGTKELNKLAMKAGKDPEKAQLMAYSNRYYDVIKALARLTRQNVNLLVDRITIGTKVHPTQAQALGDVEKTLRGLELLAAEVDRQLGLFDQFQRTFEKKRELQNRGDLRDWPYGEIFLEFVPRPPTLADLRLTKKGLKALGFGAADPTEVALIEVDPDLFDSDVAEYIRVRLQNYQDQKDWWEKVKTGFYAFWNTDHDVYAEGMELEALAFLPHVYLGIFEDWSQWGIESDPEAIRKARTELIEEYSRIPTALLPDGDTANPVITPEDHNFYPIGHTWLLLYPDRQQSTIIPVLLRTCEEIGSQVERITIGKLIELQNAEYISDQPISAYERVVEVVFEKAADGEGFALVDKLLETGRHLKDNPYLKNQQRADRARAQRDTLFIEEPKDDRD